jgi:hypothetical protein
MLKANKAITIPVTPMINNTVPKDLRATRDIMEIMKTMARKRRSTIMGIEQL